MKPRNQRLHRVAEQIQHELADLLRTEVKDPRVGMVTVTRVDVSADMAHAKVYFTALTGREHAAAAEALARTGGFLGASFSAPEAVHRAAAPLRVRRLDRVRHATLAAHRPGGRRRPQTSVRVGRMTAPRSPLRWRRVDGVLLLDKPVGLTSNAALQGRADCSRRRRRVTPARSILWRRDCCRCASARPPSSPGSCWMRRSAIRRRSASARRRRRATPKAR